jgi:hypothetical protein
LQTRDALLQMLLDKLPLPLGDDHLDDLAALGDETGEKLRRLVSGSGRMSGFVASAK